ncbi:MAG TPA: HAMP domain-containing histidine kinase [Candidatus Coprenecus stercoravium]|uniref:histidine kinase n=1 Tax=Candidatus Coprenecus stercoravium TaxID=2840735 RepID=A0A9D2GPE8_9BACT|nr:HAMP domain-containing histidine kinase [Candidatus Coprenecus stercoravium]
MRLIYRIAFRLALFLLPLMAAWAALFYFKTVDDVNDETDDALDLFTELVIERVLSGRELPPNDGTNIMYDIIPVGEQFVQDYPSIRYYYSEQYFPLIGYEPSRILTTVFMTDDGKYYLLKTYTPTIDKQELMHTTLVWIVMLYVLLLITVMIVTMLVFYRNIRPLYRLLGWLDRLKIGGGNPPLDNPTDITEFRKLNAAAEKALNRYQEAFEAQKEFIGNASHELQTPLAVIGNRVEWLIDNTELSQKQTEELLGIQRTLGSVVKLNRTLLMLTKIDNGQFPEKTRISIPKVVLESVEIFSEIYEDKGLDVDFRAPAVNLEVEMNESLASALVNNLLKNAFIYTPAQGRICVRIYERTLEISNTGRKPLDAEHIFERFYKSGGREGALGLGLAIVGAIQRYCGLEVRYAFGEGMHRFSVHWPKKVSEF